MTNGHINPANVPDIALKDGHSIRRSALACYVSMTRAWPLSSNLR